VFARGNIYYLSYYTKKKKKKKTSIGVDMNRELIFIGHIVTDEDGSLKIRQIEEFTDSKAHLDFAQAVAAIKAKKQ